MFPNDWYFSNSFIVEKHVLCFQRSNWPRGRVLGGTGSINSIQYVRGNRHDFDLWEEMGCQSWSYDNVLPYFKKSEYNYNAKIKKSGKKIVMLKSNYMW